MASSSRRTAIVGGRFAGTPGQGGATWAVLQYALGLRRLGWNVILVEPLEPSAGPPGVSEYFNRVCNRFGLVGTAALLAPDARETTGIAYQSVIDAAGRADVLLNLSGILRDPEIVGLVPNRVYVDMDPGFTQLWSDVENLDLGLEGHTHFATVGPGLAEPECTIPTCGRAWIPTLPPVVLSHWPVAETDPDADQRPFTTVANWRGYGSIRHEGILYGQKAHALRPLMELPRVADEPVQLALTIHPDERDDLASLHAGGWVLVDPVRSAGTPDRYHQFVGASYGELGIAKSGYIQAACGWFSDRSACYLASGRPVLAQETGFSRYLPTGAGLCAFATLEEAAEGLRAIRRDYASHASAARALAMGHFDSDRILTSLLQRVGVA